MAITDYTLKHTHPVCGHPVYEVVRNSDGVVVAMIQRYAGRKTIEYRGHNPRGFVRSEKLRNFWRWAFTSAGKPASHVGRASTFVESRADCLRSIVWFLEN